LWENEVGKHPLNKRSGIAFGMVKDHAPASYDKGSADTAPRLNSGKPVEVVFSEPAGVALVHNGEL
jgi:hypothetical protein